MIDRLASNGKHSSIGSPPVNIQSPMIHIKLEMPFLGLLERIDNPG
jgi:hypothetical protein